MKLGKLFFEIGGYKSRSYKIELIGNTLQYSEDRSHFNATSTAYSPKTNDWEKFGKALDVINIWDWEKSYESKIHDGIQWELVVKYEKKGIESFGSNSSPSGQDTTTSPFQQLLQAIRTLTDKSCFNSY